MSLFADNLMGRVLSFVVGLIPLILLHEIGHFIMARIFGVWAREFGIGYPPRITKLFRWRETDFTLNWIPFGGFVRLEGEDLFAEEDEEEEKTPQELAEVAEARKHSLYAKSAGARSLIYLGGPVMNLLSAWLVAVVIFLSGYPVATGEVFVVEVAPGSPAAEAQIQVDDDIVAVGGETVDSIQELITLTQKNLDTETEVTLQRDGETRTVELVPRGNPPEDQGAMGIIIGNGTRLERKPLGAAIAQGSQYFGQVVLATLTAPAYLIRGDIPLRQGRPVGVIGISALTQSSIERSFDAGALYPFLNILLLISVGLGIFNLLPIPALDGGRILFAIVEKIRGKRLSPKLEERIHVIAFLLMLALFVFITALDIIAPVPIP